MKERIEQQIGTYQEPLLRGRGNGKGLLEQTPTEFNHVTNTQMQDSTTTTGNLWNPGLPINLQSKQDGPFDGGTADNKTAGGNPEEEYPKQGWPNHYWDQFYFILKELEQEYPTLPEESPFNTIRMSIHNTLELLSGNKEETTITIPFKVGQQVWAMRNNKPYQMTIQGFELRENKGHKSTNLILNYTDQEIQVTLCVTEVFPTKQALLASL